MKHRKQLKETQPTENISLSSLQQCNPPAAPAELKPAIKFREDTLVPKESYTQALEDGAFASIFVKTTPSKDIPGAFDIMVTDAYSINANILDKIIDVSYSSRFRNDIESFPYKVAANVITDMRNTAVEAASSKYTTAITQNTEYVLADAVKCVVALVDDAGYETTANNIEQKYCEHRNVTYIMCPRGYYYLDLINDALKSGDDNIIETTYRFVSDMAMTDVLNYISRIAERLTIGMTRWLHTDPDIELNDATNALAVFAKCLAGSFDNIYNVIVDNTLSYVNEIRLICYNMYGNADVNDKTTNHICSCDVCEF